MPGEERTEAPSARRIEELRSKGQVAHSTDLTTAAGLLVSLYIARNMGGDMAIQLQALLKHTLTELGPREMSEEAITNLMAHASNVGVAVLVPIFAILPIVAIAVTMVQTGPMFTGHSLKPDLQRVNPLTALKRLFSPRSLVELVKALVDRKSTRLNSSHVALSRMPSSA